MNRQRLLSDPFDANRELSNLSPDSSIEDSQGDEVNMTPPPTFDVTLMQNMLHVLQEQLRTVVATNVQLNTKLIELEKKQEQLATTQAEAARAMTQPNVTVSVYEDVVPTYSSGDVIQLDAYKVMPEFNGNKTVYRSWRSQVTKLMYQIRDFATHPKYAAALAIIRAKITGTASDILINNNTALNINAIIDRLDFSYADKRPLYVIEAEMTNIKQNGRTLQEFYDEINQALNMVLTKIAMTYKEPAEQKSLTAETQAKAIRTFVTGLNSALIRTTLYGSMPKSLSEAFAIAQTIQYDSKHLQLEYRTHVPHQQLQKNVRNSNANFQHQQQQQWRPNAAAATVPLPKPTPMEVDKSAQYVQRPTQQQQPTTFQPKRARELQNVNRQPSFQQTMKQQRINNVEHADEIQSVREVSIDNNYDGDGCDAKSDSSEKSKEPTLYYPYVKNRYERNTDIGGLGFHQQLYKTRFTIGQ